MPLAQCGPAEMNGKGFTKLSEEIDLILAACVTAANASGRPGGEPSTRSRCLRFLGIVVSLMQVWGGCNTPPTASSWVSQPDTIGVDQAWSGEYSDLAKKTSGVRRSAETNAPPETEVARRRGRFRLFDRQAISRCAAA
jgi:hypothetical protein